MMVLQKGKKVRVSGLINKAAFISAFQPILAIAAFMYYTVKPDWAMFIPKGGF